MRMPQKSGAIADEFLQTIGGRNAKVVNCFGVGQHSSLSQSDLLNVVGKFLRTREIVDFLGFRIFERFNHAKNYGETYGTERD